VSEALLLQVPVPALSYKPVMGTFAPLEDVVTASFAAVRFPDGSAMGPDDYVDAQALLSRKTHAAAAVEIWDGGAKLWRLAGGLALDGLRGLPVVPPKSGGEPWQSLLVTAGQKDATGVPLVGAASAHFPQYRLRGVFRARRNGVEARGVGAETAPFEFASVTEARRFDAELRPDADGATRVRLVLRSAAGKAAGFLEIDASSGNTTLTLASFDAAGAPLASVSLLGDGSIRLAPAATKRVVIAGDLETEHIRYLPNTGFTKRDLD
jgi:hypothetical protein